MTAVEAVRTEDGERRRRTVRSEATGRLAVELGCEFQYETAAGTELVVVVEPPDTGDWAVRWHSEKGADVPIREYRDMYGNRCWRLTATGAALSFRYDGAFLVPDAPDPVVAEAEQTPVSQLPDEALVYTLPSRFCQSDLLLNEAWQLFGDAPAGWGRVQAICDWVHAHVEYGYGNSGPTTSALETFNERRGVCRDFAHLPITFCRALNIPARYAFGYLPDYEVVPPDVPMDFHAWFEVFLGGRWHAFDARHNRPRKGRVKAAHGRDALDVAMVTSYGMAKLVSMTVWTDAYPDQPAASST